MKKSLAPTELRKKRKLALQEQEEKIDLMGSESEVDGKTAVQEITKIEQEIEEKKKIDELNRFDMARRSVYSYKELLQISLHNLVKNINMPITYQWGVWFDGKGIIIVIKDKKGVVHKRAFKPSTNPLVDQNAVKTLALWAEDVFDKCEGKLESSIWVP
jgi:hypothetical protein